MASSSRTRPSTASRSKTSAKRSTATGKKKSGSRKHAPRRTPAPSRVGLAVSDRARDLAGVLLIALGVLGALGIYGGLAGPAGNAIDTATGAVIGLVRWFVPPALIVAGLLLLRNVPEEDGPQSDDELLGVRLTLAAGLLAISLTGLLHVGRGEPPWGSAAEEFVTAGGVLGAAAARPLSALLDTWGAVLMLITIGLLGLVLGTRASVQAATRKAGVGMQPLARGLRNGLGWLFRVGPAEQAEPEVDTGAFFDQDAEHDGDEPDATNDVEGVVLDLTDDAPAADQPEIVLDDDGGAAHAPRGSWKLPPPRLLERMGKQDVDRRIVEETGRRLEAALAEHDVQTRLVGMVVGPTVTRYELELGPGVKVARVTSLHKDIAYAMASPDVRILAPIPGKQAIGVEVPNVKREVVALGDLMAAAETRSATAPLAVPLGRDIGGRTHVADLSKMPHILIAGATGAGKSSLHQLDHHVGPHALHARRGAHDPGRPEDGRAGPVRPAAAPAHPGRGRAQEGGQRAGVGHPGDGPPLRGAAQGRRPRPRRLQRRRRRRPAGQRRQRRALRAAAVHPRRGRRAQRPDDGRRP